MDERESARSPRGPYAKGRVRRQELLDVALRLFSAGGWDAASLSAVASAAGVSREAVRHYFPTRTVLLVALLSDLDVRSRAAAAAATDTTFRGRLLSGREHTADPRTVVALVSTLTAHAITDGDAELGEAIRVRLDVLESDLAKAIQEGQAIGELRSDIPAPLLARLILGASDGVAAHDLLLDRQGSDALPILLSLIGSTPHP